MLQAVHSSPIPRQYALFSPYRFWGNRGRIGLSLIGRAVLLLNRLRTAHPILYCILSEALLLGSMVLFSLLATIGLAAAGAYFDTMDG